MQSFKSKFADSDRASEIKLVIKYLGDSLSSLNKARKALGKDRVSVSDDTNVKEIIRRLESTKDSLEAQLNNKVFN